MNMSPAAEIFVMFLTFLAMLLSYVYTSFAFMSIGKKANDSMSGLAWVPIVGNYLIATRATQMPYWPLFLFIGLGIPIIQFLFYVILIPFKIIWHWKVFEKMGWPGWWILVPIILSISGIIFMIVDIVTPPHDAPTNVFWLGLILTGLSPLIYYVQLGIVAWSKK